MLSLRKLWLCLSLCSLLIASCSNDRSPRFALPEDQELTDAVAGPVSASVISSSSISTYDFDRIRLSSTPQRDAYIVYFPAKQTGTPVPRPTVLITRPYDGFGWSQAAIDQKWAARPNANTGYAWNDEDSLAYTPAAGDLIPYSITSDTALFGDAFYYLLHKMNVAFVFNRYYAGETFVEHARDTSLALRYLTTRPEVDGARIGVNGLSWGGMTASLGISLANVPVKSLVLQSPLMDLNGINEHFTSFVPTHVSSASQQTVFSEFYRPYARRIRSMLAGRTPPAVTPLLRGSTLAPKLAGLTGSMLVLTNEWDTLVPFANTKAVVDAFPAGKAHDLYWTHSTPLDYESFAADHNPNSSTIFSQSVVMTMTNLELTQELLDPAEPVTLLVYNQTEFYNYLSYMRAEQLRGVDVSALGRMLLRMTSPQVTIMDQQDNTINAAGTVWVANWLNGIWGTSFTSANVRAYLLANGLPP